MKDINLTVRISKHDLRRKLDIKDGLPGKDATSPDMSLIVSEASQKAIEAIKPLIPTIESIETDLPKLGEQIRDSLELLEGDNRLDASAIKGLKEQFDKFENAMNTRLMSVGMNRNNIQYYDLTDQCDGSKKSFNIPGNYKVLEVKSTQFPVVYRPLIDWNVLGTTLTLGSGVGAPQSGQTFYIIYIES